MLFAYRIRSLLQSLLHTGRMERDVDPPEQNVRRAGAWTESVLQDLRYGVRTLARTPAFTVAAALSIALGVGANTAVFTLVNALLLQPLPVADAGSLVVVYGAEKGLTSGLTQISRMNFQDLERQARSFSGMAATAGPLPVGLTSGALSTPVFMEFATAGYFQVLGVRPALGRFFLPEEDRTAGGAAVAVLSYGAWQRRLGGDSSVVGRKIRLNGRPVTVIGVAPNGFRGLSTFFGPELWAPSVLAETVLEDEGRGWLQDREAAVFNVIARLLPGITRGQAEAELRVAATGLEQQYPAANRGRTIAVRPITEAAVFPGLRDGLLAGSALLLCVVGLVLVIACSNVANLLLARAAARRHEVAVRLALGAGRGRVVRQLLTESVLLALLGGSLGVALAAALKDALWARRPAVIAESLVEPQLDLTVLAYALVASVAAGIFFGLVPALQATVPDTAGTLREEGRSGGGRRRLRWARALVAGQVGLSLVCLVIAGLCLRGVQAIYAADPGFETRRLALISLNPSETGYSSPQRQQYYRDVRARLSGLPGVDRVSWASNSLLFGGASRGIEVPEMAAASVGERMRSSLVNTVDLDYFASVGLPVLRGRDFGPQDREGGVPAAVVNEAFARMYWPGGDAVGRRFRFTRETSDRVIVGVVKTAALTLLGEPPQPCVYLPLAQSPQGSMVLYVRTVSDPAPLLGVIQRTLESVDPLVKPQNTTTVRELMDNNLWIARAVVALFAGLGLLGLALAAVGLYGVIAYGVSSRQRELGLRLALGAGRGRVVLMVMRQGLSVVALGAAFGLPLAAVAARGLSSVVFRVGATDPVTFGGALAVLLLVAAAACYLPARRASRLDPAISLREG